nr:glycosyltransferase [Alicyclobacillus mali (ex Roth et al. 2021)]
MFAALGEHPCPGGVNTYIEECIAALRQKGHTVDLVDLSWYKRLPHTSLQQISIFRNELQRRFAQKVPPAYLSLELHRFIHEKIFNYFDFSSYDVVHSQSGIVSHVVRKILPDKPLVGTVHSCIATEMFVEGHIPTKADMKWFARFDEMAVHAPDTVITVTRFIDPNFPDIPPHKHEVVYNCVDVNGFQPKRRLANQKPRIVTSGRLVTRKGYDLFVRALAMLRAKGLEYEVDMYGDGPEREALEEFIRNNELPVRIMGHVEREELMNTLGSYDIFVQPSRLESFPFSTIEAMACACVPVCSAVLGMQEQVTHMENGLLVPSEDIPALAGALEKLVTNREMCAEMGRRARAFVLENFSSTAIGGRLERIYVDAIVKRREKCENAGGDSQEQEGMGSITTLVGGISVTNRSLGCKEWLESNPELRNGERVYPRVFAEAGRDHTDRYHLALRYIEENDLVLDVACGAGYGSYYIAVNTRCATVVGVDKSYHALQWGETYFRHDKVVRLNVDLSEEFKNVLPDEYRAFDKIVCFETIEHMRDDRGFLSQLYELLKPGGLLLLSAPNENVIPYGKDPYFENGKNPYHYRHYTPEQLEDLVTRHHFSVIDYYTLYWDLVMRGKGGFCNVLVCKKASGQGTQYLPNPIDAVVHRLNQLKMSKTNFVRSLDVIPFDTRFDQLIEQNSMFIECLDAIEAGDLERANQIAVRVNEDLCPEIHFLRGLYFNLIGDAHQAMKHYSILLCQGERLSPRFMAIVKESFQKLALSISRS